MHTEVSLLKCEEGIRWLLCLSSKVQTTYWSTACVPSMHERKDSRLPSCTAMACLPQGQDPGAINSSIPYTWEHTHGPL